MPIVPESWVPDAIKHAVRACEAVPNDKAYLSSSEKDLVLRLVTDQRLKSVYQNEYLKNRFTVQGWSILFDCVRAEAQRDFQKLRENAASYADKLKKFEAHLSQMAGLFEEITSLDALDFLPMELHDPFALIDRSAKWGQHPEDADDTDEPLSDPDNLPLEYTFAQGSQAEADFEKTQREQEQMEVLYKQDIEPLLQPLNRFDTRYYPSVSIMMQTMAGLVEKHRRDLDKHGPNRSNAMIDTALNARQFAALPFFVRYVDASMARPDNHLDIGGSDFQIPAEAMAIIAEVALNESPGSFEAKQVTSVRNLVNKKPAQVNKKANQ